jgi:hypothetical protein
MKVARTTYRTALVAAAISCIGYASLAHADRGDGRGGWRGDDRGGSRWTEQRAPERYDRHWDGRGDAHRYGRPGWSPPRYGWHDAPRWAPAPRYWRPSPPAYYYSPPRYYRPYPGAYAYPRYYGGWRGTGYAYPRYDGCDDADVSLTIRIPF